MAKEPIKHHYIPQFIQRSFADDNGKVCFFDNKKKESRLITTCEIFMQRNLYRDEKLFPCDPVKIEKDLSKFENEASQVLRRFRNGNEIIISNYENEMLQIFFFIMSFRSPSTYRSVSKSISVNAKTKLSMNQNEDIREDLWKRNLGYLVNCRTINEILEHPHIDKEFKIFARRDTFSFFGKYFSVAECPPTQSFVLGDTYPVTVSGSIQNNGYGLHMYDIFPITPNRVILFSSNGATGTPPEVLSFRPAVIHPPKTNETDNCITIRVKKLFPEECDRLNQLIIKESVTGYIQSSSHNFPLTVEKSHRP